MRCLPTPTLISNCDGLFGNSAAAPVLGLHLSYTVVKPNAQWDRTDPDPGQPSLSERRPVSQNIST